MSLQPPEIFARIYARHGHRCPMSTLGGILGQAAMRWLDDDDELTAIYHSRTCALDGIAETTGCSEENGRLSVASDGRHCLILQTPQTRIELEITEEALELSGQYRSLCNRLELGWDALEPAEQTRRRSEMDAMLDSLLPQFWQAEETTLIRKVDS
ncbi:MAG: formylmethanofuran dehydrogenase subunit E family protein [Desulfuromonadales bacterium]|nr:formylmethanofuran dehydrogenase subunit E family protein [Desulfuromonadales bacterium]